MFKWKSRAFDPILEAFFSCLQFPCCHVLPVWFECHVTTKVGCRLGGECSCLCLCLAMDFLSQSRWPQLCHVRTSPFLCIWLWRFPQQNCGYGHPYVHRSGNSSSGVLLVVCRLKDTLSLRCRLPGSLHSWHGTQGPTVHIFGLCSLVVPDWTEWCYTVVYG